MDGPTTRQELRELQRPIKERFADDPEAAQVTLEAEGSLVAACAGVTMRSVALSMGLSVSGLVHAEGDLDGRGALSVDRQAPVGFKEIRPRFELASDATDEELEALQGLTERYCVVFQTLAESPSLSVSLERG